MFNVTFSNISIIFWQPVLVVEEAGEPGECHRWITEQLIQAYHQCDVGSRSSFKLQKGCTRLAAASDKAYQLLAHGRWHSPF
jgi:hypothetical protein